MKERSLYRLKIFMALCSAVLFAAVMIWLIIGINSADSTMDEQHIRDVKQSVMNGAVLCYSVEGYYPEDLAYLKENYGLTYDENKYLVHYKFISSDICPNVLVYGKQTSD